MNICEAIDHQYKFFQGCLARTYRVAARSSPGLAAMIIIRAKRRMKAGQEGGEGNGESLS